MEKIKQVYLFWNGRASRKTYWIFSIPILVLFLLVEFIFTNLNEYIYYGVLLIGIYTSMMINIKRAHDRNRTGFFSLLLIVPIVSLWPLVEFGLLAGTDGLNKYGEPDIW